MSVTLNNISKHKKKLKRILKSLLDKEAEQLELTNKLLEQFMLMEIGVDPEKVKSLRKIPRSRSNLISQWDITMEDGTKHTLKNPHKGIKDWKGE